MRRLVWFLVAAVVAAGSVAGCGGDDSGSDSPAADSTRSSNQATFIATQTAESGTVADGELTLVHPASQVTLFSDRPERAVKTVQVGDFAESFAKEFGDDPPNGSLASIRGGQQSEYVIELRDAFYDRDADTITYSFSPVSDEPPPKRFGGVSLVIDDLASSGVSALRTPKEVGPY